MSEPSPEYAPDDDAAAFEPGVPDEMVEEYIDEPVPEFGFNAEFASEFAPLLLATLLAMAVVEALLKPLLKALLDLWRGKDRDKSADPTLIRMLAFLAGCCTSVTFGFRAMVYDLTGQPLSVIEEVLYGGSSVAVCSLVIYLLIEETRPIKALKVMIGGLYKRAFAMIAGREMTKDEEAALEKTVKRPPVDPEAVGDENA